MWLQLALITQPRVCDCGWPASACCACGVSVVARLLLLRSLHFVFGVWQWIDLWWTAS